jgi:hypothetical protein
MNKKLVLIGILLLVGLMLSGCLLPPPPFSGYGRGDGYYGDSHGHDHGDRDRDHGGSGRGSRHWR